MARYIDAELAKEALTGWETDPLDEEIERAIDNIPTADVAPRTEVARKIFGEVEDLMREWFDFFRQADDIRESCAIMAALSQISELKKKYTEEKT